MWKCEDLKMKAVSTDERKVRSHGYDKPSRPHLIFSTDRIYGVPAVHGI